jgi:hypothetical protein
MTNTTKVIVGVVFLALAGALFFWLNQPEPPAPSPVDEIIEPFAPTTTRSILGQSIEGRDIETFTFGTGETNLLFIGGIHGGYEWNSALLAYEMIDYFMADNSDIPENITVHIIPNLNPDGLYSVTQLEGKFAATQILSNDMHATGEGRFNANDVDLNRNFDCRWVPTGSWRGKTVSAGSAPFSEPEAVIVRDYVNQINPAAVVVWHSKANNVYGSECGNPVAANTLSLMNTYAEAANYGKVPVFDAYPVTGAIEDWLASINIPAVSVELETRTSSEFNRNLAGTMAILDMYGK